MASGSVNRFFGGPPLWVAVRLAVISLVVGLILSGLGISPFELYESLERLVRSLWNMGFAAIEQVFRYFLIGAVIVLPVWLLLRLLKFGRGRE